MTGSNIVVRRDAFDRVDGFDPGLPVQNDRDFFLRLLEVGLAYAVQPEPLVSVREHQHGSADRRLGPTRRRGAAVPGQARARTSPGGTGESCATPPTTPACPARPRVSEFVRSAFGALVNWSPTVARDLPLNLFRVGRMRSMLKKLMPRATW